MGGPSGSPHDVYKWFNDRVHGDFIPGARLRSVALSLMPGQKILVVDDEDHILELARLYLSREGYQIEAVSDGAQALARFGQTKPDLVVLDIMLPNVDGLTICKEIRQQSQVPIIMLTARHEGTDKVVALELGADDYLTKPFHPQEL